MKALHEIYDHAISLIEDFNSVDTYLLIGDVFKYKKSLLTLLESKYTGEAMIIFTNSYGYSCILTTSELYTETLETYIDSLEPASESEKEEFTDTTNSMMLADL